MEPSLKHGLEEMTPAALSILTFSNMVLKIVRRLPLHQLFVVTLVGVASGVYIYKPLLEKYASKRDSSKKKEEVSTVGTADSDAVKKTTQSPSTPAKQNVTGALLIRVKRNEGKSSSQ